MKLRHSQMPGLGWNRHPVIVTTVEVANRCVDQCLNGRIVETGDVDGVVLAAKLFQIALPIRMETAATAEPMVHAVRAELVIAQILLA